MRIPRVFVPPSHWRGREEAWITGDDARHLTRVLRLAAGSKVLLLDGSGRVYAAEVREVDREGVWALVTGPAELPADPGLRVTLVPSLAKGERMDDLVQKATEVGVAAIVPVVSERTVVRLTPEKAGRRVERWRRIATEAAEQCRRPLVPDVLAVCRFEEALGLVPAGGAAFFLWEEERGTGLKDALRSRPPAREVFLFTGPEGGFTPEEAAAAAARGAISVSLGPRLLRADTAGVVAATLVLYEWGDIG